MIRLSGQLICKTKAEAAQVSAHLPEHIRLSREEPGCLSFEVTQIATLVWQVEESFASQQDFDAHQRRTRASDWFRATEGVARSYQITGPKGR